MGNCYANRGKASLAILAGVEDSEDEHVGIRQFVANFIVSYQ
jgi:hypothetical protein